MKRAIIESKQSARLFFLVALLGAALAAPGCTGGIPGDVAESPRVASVPRPDTLRIPGEVHFKNVRQLTFGGENAEAYFSPDGRELVFQATTPPFACDQIFRMPVAGGEPTLVSSGEGRTTCAYFLPDTAWTSMVCGASEWTEPPVARWALVSPIV